MLRRRTLVLGVLWWAWVGYAWLTSVIDPEEGAVRLVMFVAMAALLVTSLAIPDAFGDWGYVDDAGLDAAAYGGLCLVLAMVLLARRDFT